MDDHPRTMGVNSVFPRFVKMKFVQSVAFRADLEPVIVGKLDLNPIVVAIIKNGQCNRLITEVEPPQSRSFRLIDIDGRLHVSYTAGTLPMVRSVRPWFIRKMWLALLIFHAARGRRMYGPGYCDS